MRMIAAFSAIFLLMACAPSRPRPIPPVVDAVGVREQAMGCEQLNIEIQQARTTYQAAEANVGFEWWDLTLVHVPYSWFKSERSEWAAEDRLQQLQGLAQQRGCTPSPSMPAAAPPPASMGTPYPPQNWQATPSPYAPADTAYPPAPPAGHPPPAQQQDNGPWGQRGQVNLP